MIYLISIFGALFALTWFGVILQGTKVGKWVRGLRAEANERIEFLTDEVADLRKRFEENPNGESQSVNVATKDEVAAVALSNQTESRTRVMQLNQLGSAFDELNTKVSTLKSEIESKPSTDVLNAAMAKATSAEKKADKAYRAANAAALEETE